MKKPEYTKSQMADINRTARLFCRDLIDNQSRLTMAIMSKVFAVAAKIKNAQKSELQCDVRYKGRNFGHFKMVFERTKKPKHRKE